MSVNTSFGASKHVGPPTVANAPTHMRDKDVLFTSQSDTPIDTSSILPKSYLFVSLLLGALVRHLFRWHRAVVRFGQNDVGNFDLFEVQ